MIGAAFLGILALGCLLIYGLYAAIRFVYHVKGLQDEHNMLQERYDILAKHHNEVLNEMRENERKGKDKLKNQKGFIALVPLALIAIIGITVIFGSWFVVDQGYRGIKLRFGEVVGTYEPGLGFKMPLVHSVVDVEVRTQRFDAQTMGYSKDIQNATYSVSLNYHLDPAMVTQIYSQLGTDYEGRLLGPTFFRVLKEQTGKFTAAEIVNQRDRLGAAISEAMSEEMQGSGINIEQVQITNVDFSDEFEKSIEARMQAEVEVQRQAQILERQKIEAETTKVNADANAYKITVEADANADAIRKQSEALRVSPQYVEWVKAQRWDGKLPVTMLPNGATPLIDLRN